MKSLLKSVLLILSGVIISLGLLYGYSVIFKTAAGDYIEESLRFVPIEPGDAIFSQISGEVFVIREEKILTPKAGDGIREGDVIKVVNDSWCQIHFVGKATMNLRSNTLVKIQRLLSSTKDTDIRTELLTGSMIYKVDKLELSDNLEVIAQEKIYRVEGTEFFVEAFTNGGSSVAVKEGKVAVLLSGAQDEAFIKSVPPGFSLDLNDWKKGTEPPDLNKLTQEQIRLFEKEGPGLPFVNKEELIYLEIVTEPAGAEVYINGRLTGRGRLSGLFPGDKILKIIVRKRGYEDKNENVTPGKLESSNLLFQLEPLGLDESLKSESMTAWPDPLKEIKARYEKEFQTLSSGFSSKIEETAETIKNLKNLSMNLESDIKGLKRTNSDLENQLEKSQEEQKKLRELLIQIQELSEQP
jgi:hypothetical protein